MIPSGPSSEGVDRGFIFLEDGGIAWRGITKIEESESGYRTEKYYVDGKKIAQRHYSGDYEAQITSYDDPFENIPYLHKTFGLSYRENMSIDNEPFYRLHIVHDVSVIRNSSATETHSDSPTPTLYVWDMGSVKGPLDELNVGSHIIIDSRTIYPWIMREIEMLLYGYPDGNAHIPTVEELITIFETMELVIIDHGDGTWSAIGHDAMVFMLDPTEFEIASPSIDFVDDDPHTYEIESWSRSM